MTGKHTGPRRDPRERFAGGRRRAASRSGSHDRRGAARPRGTAPRSSGSGASGSPARPARPTNRGSTTPSVSSITGTPIDSSPITSGERRDAYRPTSSTTTSTTCSPGKRPRSSKRADSRPFFVYLNYTVPHAELRVPEDSIAPFRGKFEERPFSNPAADARPTGSRPEGPSLGYRSQPAPYAAFAGMITRMDRDVGRLADLIHARGLDERTLILFISDNGPHKEGGADPALLQQLRRTARHQAGSLRGRHPRPDDRALAGHDPRRSRQRPGVGALGPAADPGGACRRAPAIGARRHVDGERRSAAKDAWSMPRSIGSSTSRISAGGADGPLEGSPVEAGVAAGSFTISTPMRTRRTTWPPRTPTSSLAWNGISSRRGRHRSAGRRSKRRQPSAPGGSSEVERGSFRLQAEVAK